MMPDIFVEQHRQKGRPAPTFKKVALPFIG
jgi:hypothetical protein